MNNYPRLAVKRRKGNKNNCTKFRDIHNETQYLYISNIFGSNCPVIWSTQEIQFLIKSDYVQSLIRTITPTSPTIQTLSNPMNLYISENITVLLMHSTLPIMTIQKIPEILTIHKIPTIPEILKKQTSLINPSIKTIQRMSMTAMTRSG